jgi:winged helix domain-containing protein
MTEQNNKAVFTVTNPKQQPFTLPLAGRNRWALEQLAQAGRKGCTPINNPAPRWSAYVFNLRQFGVDVETLHEPHTGKYPGNHARYVLRATVTLKAEGGAV